MAGNETKLEFLDFSVFRAGIASDDAELALGEPHSNIENQYAVFEEGNTYGCVAGTKTGLKAGPRIVDMDYTMSPATIFNPNWAPDPGLVLPGVLDTGLISPFMAHGLSDEGVSARDVQQAIMLLGFCAFSVLSVPTFNGTGYHGLRKIGFSGVSNVVSALDDAGSYHGLDSGNVGAVAPPGGFTMRFNDLDFYGYLSINPFRFLKNPMTDDKAKVGSAAFINTSCPPDTNATLLWQPSVISTLADAVAPGWSANAIPGAANIPTTSCIHQGRLVIAAGIADFGAWAFEPGFGVGPGGKPRKSMNNNNLHFTQRYNFNAAADWATGTAAGKTIVLPNEAKWNNINALLSVNYNDLVVLNSTSGITVVRGDIESAGSQILHFPGVTPTYGSTPKPVATDLGVVYGSRSGIFLWNGGDKSQSISQQLRDDFWRTDFMDYQWMQMQPKGKLAYRYPYIFAPNDWLYDVRTQSWWKLRPTESNPYIHYDVQHNGQVYGTRGEIAVDSPNPKFFGRIDPEFGQSKFKARTHPISATISRRTRLREIIVRTRGHGGLPRMFVRVYADGGVLKKEFQIECKNDQTINTLLNVDVTGTDLQLEFESEEVHGVVAAPDLLGFRMGYSVDSKYLGASS